MENSAKVTEAIRLSALYAQINGRNFVSLEDLEAGVYLSSVFLRKVLPISRKFDLAICKANRAAKTRGASIVSIEDLQLAIWELKLDTNYSVIEQIIKEQGGLKAKLND